MCTCKHIEWFGPDDHRKHRPTSLAAADARACARVAGVADKKSKPAVSRGRASNIENSLRSSTFLSSLHEQRKKHNVPAKSVPTREAIGLTHEVRKSSIGMEMSAATDLGCSASPTFVDVTGIAMIGHT